MRIRKTYSGVTSVMGGCYVCHGDEAYWFSRNAMGVAARHHDATGHTTWAEQVVSVRYGAVGIEESLEQHAHNG